MDGDAFDIVAKVLDSPEEPPPGVEDSFPPARRAMVRNLLILRRLSNPHAPAPGIRPGMVIGGCQVEALIGKGGMGVVYRGRDLNLGRTVAIKTIRDDITEAGRERFHREAAAMAKLSHSAVANVFA